MVKIFTNLWFGGKCLLINLMNILPILVLTDLLYGGFNQIMLGFPFFFFWLFSFLLVAHIVAWFYIHFFLGILHSKCLTPEKCLLMMTKLRVLFQLIMEFLYWFVFLYRVDWIDVNIVSFFVGFSVRAIHYLVQSTIQQVS